MIEFEAVVAAKFINVWWTWKRALTCKHTKREHVRKFTFSMVCWTLYLNTFQDTFWDTFLEPFL